MLYIFGLKVSVLDQNFFSMEKILPTEAIEKKCCFLIFKMGFHPPRFRVRVTKIPVQCSRVIMCKLYQAYQNYHFSQQKNLTNN